MKQNWGDWKDKAFMKIRRMKSADYAGLEDFLYNAVYIPPGEEMPPREVIFEPEIYIYIDGFGSKSGDLGVVAEQDGKIIGAAWTRIIPAYGHVDENTPELAISILAEYRGKGIGTKMMKKLFAFLAEKGYKQTSLSVQKNNPAVRFYERLGYKITNEKLDHTGHEDYIMVRDLSKERQEYGVSLGICFGVAFGSVIGTITGNIGFWLPIGLCLGISCGAAWSLAGKSKKKK